MRPGAAGRKMPAVKIFFVTDLHGSEICWKKFLNAGPFYGADVVIVGGDVTGKAMVPIVQRSNGAWEASLQDHRETFETDAEVVEFEKRVMNRGYYPIRVSDEEYVAMQEDEDLVDKRFKEVMLDGTERWIAMAEDKLADTGIRVVACPANDDMFEIDDLLTHAHVVETGDEEHPIELDGFTMISMGWTNPTPWHTFREAEEPELADADPASARARRRPRDDDLQLPRAAVRLQARQRARAQRGPHVQVGGTGAAARGLDVGPGGDRVVPADARAARAHPREQGRGPDRDRRSSLNPGSSYEEGILQAAVVTIDAKKRKVKNYQLVNG